MLGLTGKSVLTCKHGGIVRIDPAQDWVTIEGVPVLVEPDLLHRPIATCPQATPTTPPCTLTISVDEAVSYSALVSIDGKRICLDTSAGRTNWSLLAIVPFGVRETGQALADLGA
jgi:hypothetical protein